MFITFEGPDGSGKTTALKTLKKYLDKKNIEYVFTREPGGSDSKAAKEIRNVILNPEHKITDMTEALLYAADRRLNLELNVWPALKEGKLVLCDRYLDSTFAYQGYGRGLGFENMLNLQKLITENTFPDITILFDISPEESEKRVLKRAEKDRLELAGKEFNQKVYEGYMHIAKMFPERIKIIDATKNEEEVFESVKKIVLSKISDMK